MNLVELVTLQGDLDRKIGKLKVYMTSTPGPGVPGGFCSGGLLLRLLRFFQDGGKIHPELLEKMTMLVFCVRPVYVQAATSHSVVEQGRDQLVVAKGLNNRPPSFRRSVGVL